MINTQDQNVQPGLGLGPEHLARPHSQQAPVPKPKELYVSPKLARYGSFGATTLQDGYAAGAGGSGGTEDPFTP